MPGRVRCRTRRRPRLRLVSSRTPPIQRSQSAPEEGMSGSPGTRRTCARCGADRSARQNRIPRKRFWRRRWSTFASETLQRCGCACQTLASSRRVGAQRRAYPSPTIQQASLSALIVTPRFGAHAPFPAPAPRWIRAASSSSMPSHTPRQGRPLRETAGPSGAPSPEQELGSPSHSMPRK